MQKQAHKHQSEDDDVGGDVGTVSDEVGDDNNTHHDDKDPLENPRVLHLPCGSLFNFLGGSLSLFRHYIEDHVLIIGHHLHKQEGHNDDTANDDQIPEGGENGFTQRNNTEDALEGVTRRGRHEGCGSGKTSHTTLPCGVGGGNKNGIVNADFTGKCIG